MMDRENFLKKLISYNEESKKQNYSNIIIEQDLNRLIIEFENYIKYKLRSEE